MLHEFITVHRLAIAARATEMSAERSAGHTVAAMRIAFTAFLDQLAVRLRGDSSGDLAATAAALGYNMLQEGFSVAQVVQGYGDVCQAVTAFAIESDALITTEEFRALNGCLDRATAEAVAEYERQRDRLVSGRETERLAILAHELRNKLGSALMSFDALQRGAVGIGGSTSAILGRSLSGLRELVDRALLEARLDGGGVRSERMRAWQLVEEVEIIANFEANKREINFAAHCNDRSAELDLDRHIVAAALGNLVQNAIKFTPPGGDVSLGTETRGKRMFFHVRDECGGLPEGAAETLFQPYSQRGLDRTGLGLGLLISRRAVEANGGTISVVDLPQKGCIFTVALPLVSPAAATLADSNQPA